MKKGKVNNGMRPRYGKDDLGKGVRGKYLTAYAEAHNIVRLDPEVAKAFPSEKAVNEALMTLIEVARASRGCARGFGAATLSSGLRLWIGFLTVPPPVARRKPWSVPYCS